MDATTLEREVSHENREDHPVVQYLQREVNNAFVLYANYKHYHWQTFGPLFRDIHLMFDEFVEHALKSIDEFAERIRMIGQDVQSVEPRQFQEGAAIQPAQRSQSLRKMIEEADANLMIVIRNMREGAKAADDANDPGTTDLFARMVQLHEKDEWFLRELLKKRDGLVV